MKTTYIDSINHGVSRRTLLKGAMLTTCGLALPSISTATAANPGKVVFVTWGGTYKQAMEQAVALPFREETGIEVILVDGPDLIKIKAQIMTNKIEWDVIDAPGAMSAAGSKLGYWEPLDSNILDASDIEPKPAADQAPYFIYAGGFGYDPERGSDIPQSFADLFNAERFPGRRALRNRASETLEAALMADGVKGSELYPLDIDRAFKSLDRIKPHVVKWVDSTPQTITLLETKEVDYSFTYASRIRTTQAAGSKMAFQFGQTIRSLEYLTVVKGSPNRDNAMKFIQFAMRPEVQAAAMEMVGNVPTSLRAQSLLSPETRKWIPDNNPDLNPMLNDTWWAENYEAVTQRFKEWALS